MPSSEYIDVQCPTCGLHAVIEEYTHYPAARRFGPEIILGVYESQCGCEWTQELKERAFTDALTADD